MTERIPIYNPYFPKLKTDKYERYLPSAFDESNSMLEKINNIIEYIRLLSSHYENTLENLDDIRRDQYQRIEDLYDDFYKIKLWIESKEEHLREDFSVLEDWTKGVGLRLQTKHILTQWLNDGNLADIINEEVFDMKADKDYVDGVDDYRRTESIISRKKPRKPMITIVDDDGWKEVYTILFKLAKEFNIPITSAMITGYAMGFPGDTRTPNSRLYNYNQVMEMRDSGLIEFIGHSHNNINARNSPTQVVRDDLRQSKEFLKKWGLNHRTMAFPGGKYDERTLGIAKEFFDYGVGSATSMDSNKRIVTPETANNYRLGRYSGDGRNDFDNISKMMDRTIEENGWLILTTHIEQAQGTDEARIRKIITTALAKGLEFVTVEEGIKAHGNIAQFGGTNMNPETTISSEGIVYSNRLGRVIHDNSNQILSSTPLHYFTPNATTVSIIRAVQLNGFPIRPEKSGILKTIRLLQTGEEDVWNYQILTTTRNKNIWVRYWVHDDPENIDGYWGDWVNITQSQYIGMNAMTPETQPNIGLFARKETVTTINRAGNEGFPENKSGVLKTTAHTLDGFIYQTYDIYRENKQYKRTWYNGRWGEWELVKSRVLNFLSDSLGFNSNKKPTEYPIGRTIEVVDISSSDGTGLPDEQTGSIFTERTATENVGSRYVYQNFKVNGEFVEYTRVGLYNNEWSEWYEHKPTYYERGFDNSKLAEDYPIGVVYSVVNLSDDKTGLPNEETGTIITERTASSSLGRYSYQTFIANGTNHEYKRKLQSDGSWGSWFQYQMVKV